VTERLYWADARRFVFDAKVVSVQSDGDVVLDATCFYPEAGGQMADHGTLVFGDKSARVVDVQLDGDVIHHFLTGPLPEAGATVRGEVDASRRLEHMALHTGQHLLSRALFDVAEARTLSARLGESGATLDLDRTLSARQRDEAEARVNQVIDEARPIRAFFPTDAELDALDLRRAPKVADGIRAVLVEEFDATPCGGTHCGNTSEVGQLVLRDVSSHKGGVRVLFSAGIRARRELAETRAQMRALADRFTCASADVAAAIAKVERQLAEARESLGVARSGWADAVADTLASTPSPVIRSFDGLDRETLRALATKLATADRVALLAAASAEGTALVAMRGPESDFDCGAFVSRLAKACGGGGGGRPQRAEGKLPGDTDFEDAATRALP